MRDIVKRYPVGEANLPDSLGWGVSDGHIVQIVVIEGRKYIAVITPDEAEAHAEILLACVQKVRALGSS